MNIASSHSSLKKKNILFGVDRVHQWVKIQRTNHAMPSTIYNITHIPMTQGAW